MNYPEIMIDIETLGTGDGAAIVQIGAVRFNLYDGKISDNGFKRNILWSCDNFGNIEPDTLQWWLTQNPEVREEVFRQADARPLRDALVHMNEWVYNTGPVVTTIWACPPNFDHRLIQQACKRTGVPYRFSFFKERDFRTVRNVFGVEADSPEFEGNKHDALDDARFQAQYLINILQRISEKDPTN